MKPQPLDLNFDGIMEAFFLVYKDFDAENWQKFWEEYKKAPIVEDIKLILDIIRQRIKSACEFYLKYKDKPELLLKEHPNLKEEIERIIQKNEKITQPKWMVLLRHFGMSGGIINYGTAKIIDFYETFEEADEEAREEFKNISEAPFPYVWILKCERTYQDGGIAESHKYNEWLFKLAFKDVLKGDSDEEEQSHR